VFLHGSLEICNLVVLIDRLNDLLKKLVVSVDRLHGLVNKPVVSYKKWTKPNDLYASFNIRTIKT
jgi:hypothetical protein